MQMNDWDIRTNTLLGLTCLWVSFLAKMVKKKKEKKRKNSLRGFGSFRDAVFIPRASNEELSKIHFEFEQEWQRHEVSVSIRLGREVISGVRPTDQRRSAGTTFSGFDD